MDPAAIVAGAWHRVCAERRTLRARAARTAHDDLDLLGAPQAADRSGVEAVVVELTDAVRSGRLGVDAARALACQAAGWSSVELAGRTGIPAATLRAVAAGPGAGWPPWQRGSEVLSIGVIGATGVGYYLDTVGRGVDDYYLRAEPGRWYGAAADGLGLGGTVTDADLHAVLAGRHPGTGALLGAPMGKVAAFDLTFSAPKSVSLLAELADPTTRAAVADAHRRAVAQAIGLLEAEAARGRRGHNGAVTLPVEGITAAGFDHRTSRAGDPQLHTHLLVANRARGVDGRWGALYGRAVFGWARTVGFAYQAALRHELTTTLGVAWRPVTAGTAELAAVPDTITAAFSTRRAQITAQLEAAGATSARAAQTATLATRPAKPDPVDPDTQRDRWREQARAAGLDLDVLDGLAGLGRQPTLVDAAALTRTLAGPAGLTARRSSFDRRAVIEAVCAAAPDGLQPRAVPGLTAAVLADERFVPTGSPGVLAGPTWTTVELLTTEARVLERVDRHRHAGLAVCPADTVTATLADRPTLAGEQADMVRRLTGDGHGVSVVVGPAGTGKTYALDAARHAWTAAGVDLVGTALAARTARALEAGTGIPSATLDQLLADAKRPGPQLHPALPPGGVLVVDEAGMVGTRKLDRLLAAAERTRTKVVLVGDPRQLPEIEAGGVLGALARTRPVIELAANRRQAETWERDALAELRAGRPDRAVVALSDHGRITLAPTSDDARHRLVADWTDSASPDATRRGDGGTVMVALTRADVEDLNARARTRLEDLGRLDPDRDTVEIRPGVVFGVGERVLALRNDRRVGLVNGTTGTVVSVGADGGLTLRPDRGPAQDIAVPAGYLADGHLTHGWAVTVHKAQGLTTGRAFLLGTDRLYREAGYVALSRAVERTDWYHVAPDDPGRSTTDELTRLLVRSRAQQLATPDPTTGPLDTVHPAAHTSQPASDRVRRHAREATVLADPGTHLIDALGPPPLAGTGRPRWAATAVLVDDYHARWPTTPHRLADTVEPRQPSVALDGPVDPLGPRPDSRHPEQLRDWTRARLAIADLRRHLGLDHDHSLGLDR